MRRPVTLLALSVITLVGTGCSTFARGNARSQTMAPSGLPWGEELVRRALVVEGFEQAMNRTAKGQDGAPDDDVLRAFFRGQTSFYAGHFSESASQFAAADRLAERRVTRSASRGVLSLITNDRALAYVPTRTERLFSRYYAMLSYVQAGDASAAGVEARRLSQELAQADADGVDEGERPTHAMLREVAGAVFASNGDWNDAAVAYRNAARLRGASPDAIDAFVQAQTERPAGDSATVLLVLESGFAAHYVERELTIPLANAALHPMIGPNGRGVRGPRIQSSPEHPVRAVEIGDTIDANVSPVKQASARTLTGMITRRGSRDKSSVAPATPIWNSPLGALSTRGPERRREVAKDEDDAPAPASDLGVGVNELVGPGDDLASRLLAVLDEQPDGGVFADERPGALMASAPENASHSVALDWTPVGGAGALNRTIGGPWHVASSWLTVAWPALVRPRLPSAPVRFGMADGPIASVQSQANGAALISDALAADARRARGARVARLLARSASRAVVVDAVRDKHGDVAGFLASLAGSALERADTRGWHLLPGQVTVVRLTVPAGAATPQLHIGPDPNARAVAMPIDGLAPGAIRVVTTRIWRDPPGVATSTDAAPNGPNVLLAR